MPSQAYSMKHILRILGEGCLWRSPTEQVPPATHCKAGKCHKVIMAKGMAEPGGAAGGRNSIFKPKRCIKHILTLFFLVSIPSIYPLPIFSFFDEGRTSGYDL